VKRLFALTLLTAVSPAIAQGQGDRRAGVFVGRGVELLNIRDGSRWTPAITWQAGFYIKPIAERLGFRAVATFFDQTQVLRSQAMGFALEGSYELNHAATRPYLVAGAGASWLYMSPSFASPSGSVVDPGVERWSGLVSAGAGLQQRIGGLWVFGEARWNTFTNGRGWAPFILPVSFGVRF